MRFLMSSIGRLMTFQIFCVLEKYIIKDINKVLQALHTFYGEESTIIDREQHPAENKNTTI